MNPFISSLVDEILTPQALSSHYCLRHSDSSLTRVPFSNRLWAMRAAVQRGFEAFYTVQVSTAAAPGPSPYITTVGRP